MIPRTPEQYREKHRRRTAARASRNPHRLDRWSVEFITLTDSELDFASTMSWSAWQVWPWTIESPRKGAVFSNLQ